MTYHNLLHSEKLLFQKIYLTDGNEQMVLVKKEDGDGNDYVQKAFFLLPVYSVQCTILYYILQIKL